MPSASPAGRPIVAFLAIAFAISWLIFLPLVLGADGLNVFHYSLPAWWLALGTAGPIIAASVVSHRETGRRLPSRFFPSATPRGILNLFTAPILILLSVDAIPYLLSTQSGSRHPQWSVLAPLLAWIEVLGGPLGEEFGWRGFLLPRLMAHRSPALATLILGLIWTAWHLPLFLVQTWSSAPLWFFAILTVGVSFPITFGYNLTGGSILAAILAHYTFNTTAAIYVNLLGAAAVRPGVDPFLLVQDGLAALVFVLVAATRGRLGHPGCPATPSFPDRSRDGEGRSATGIAE